MKGPSGRLKYDVRRVWECPVCGRREYTGGQVVNRACPCHPDADPPRPVWMHLVEERPAGKQAKPESPPALDTGTG